MIKKALALLEELWNGSRLEDLVDGDPFTAKTVASTEVVGQAYRRFLRRLCIRLNAHAAGLFFYVRGKMEFDFVIHVGYPDHVNVQEWNIEPVEGIVGKVAREGTAFVDAVAQVDGFRDLHGSTTHQVTVPIFEPRSKRLFAVFNLEFASAPGRLAREMADPALAEPFGIRLLSLLRRLQLARLAFSANKLRESGEANNSDTRLKIIASALHSLIHRDAEVAILLRRGLALELRPEATAGLSGLAFPDIGRDLQVDDERWRSGIVLKVARRGKPLYTPNVFKDRHYLPVKSSTKSQFTVPLVSGERLVGVLLIGSPILFGLPSLLRPLIEIYAAQAAQLIDSITALETLTTHFTEQKMGFHLVQRRLRRLRRTQRLRRADVRLLERRIVDWDRVLGNRVLGRALQLKSIPPTTPRLLKDALRDKSVRPEDSPVPGSLAERRYRSILRLLVRANADIHIAMPSSHVRIILLSMIGLAHRSAQERNRDVTFSCESVTWSRSHRYIRIVAQTPKDTAEILDFSQPDYRGFTTDTTLLPPRILDDVCSQFSCFLGNRPSRTRPPVPLRRDRRGPVDSAGNRGHELIFLLRVVKPVR